MITVSNADGTQDIHLLPLDGYTTAHDAAHLLWQEVHKASKAHGGEVTLRTPEDGEWGYLVRWDGGPEQWADAFVVNPESSAPGFTVAAEEGIMIRLTDLD